MPLYNYGMEFFSSCVKVKAGVHVYGKKDIALARYFEDEDRYADLINGYVFSGNRWYPAPDILEKNILVTGVLGTVRKWFAVQKYRDAVKRVVMGMNFAVIALEHQDLVHYGMPVRSCSRMPPDTTNRCGESEKESKGQGPVERSFSAVFGKKTG